jgi:hypothetical protein
MRAFCVAKVEFMIKTIKRWIYAIGGNPMGMIQLAKGGKKCGI